MKPRLRLHTKIWDCRLPDYYISGVIGFGYTPLEAFHDWKSRQSRYERSVRESRRYPSSLMDWRTA